MAEIASERLTRTTGVNLGATGVETQATAGTNTLANDGNTRLLVRNAGEAPHSITVHFLDGPDGQEIEPIVIPLAAAGASGSHVMLGAYPPAVFGRTVTIDADSTDVRFQAVSG